VESRTLLLEAFLQSYKVPGAGSTGLVTVNAVAQMIGRSMATGGFLWGFMNSKI
jgi:hypothetical protein